MFYVGSKLRFSMIVTVSRCNCEYMKVINENLMHISITQFIQTCTLAYLSPTSKSYFCDLLLHSKGKIGYKSINANTFLVTDSIKCSFSMCVKGFISKQ